MKNTKKYPSNTSFISSILKFGLSKKKAIIQIEKSGFSLGKVYYRQNEDLIPYTVLDQSLKPGTVLEKSAAIDLTISVLDLQDIFNNIID